MEEELDREDSIKMETGIQEASVCGGGTQMETRLTKDGESTSKGRSTLEKKATRQSQRVKEQVLGAINITKKATLAAQRRAWKVII
jgi:hypothetical protein